VPINFPFFPHVKTHLSRPDFDWFFLYQIIVSQVFPILLYSLRFIVAVLEGKLLYKISMELAERVWERGQAAVIPVPLSHEIICQERRGRSWRKI
jgi:hypothetical protein